MPLKRPVHFVFARKSRDVGSTVMRGEQLAALAAEHGGSTREYRYSPTDHRVRNSTLFLTKNALKVLAPEDLERYARRGNILLFDVLDEAPPPTTAGFADGIVAASRTALRDFSLAYPSIPTFLVNHHVDPRIAKLPLPAQNQEFKAGYFGELSNTVTTPSLEQQVGYVLVSTNTRNSDWLDRLPDYNLHFAIRQSVAVNLHKPFLKGFTAAHCGANVLIQASELEATLWLGTDYPYLVEGNPAESAIVAALESARDSFGSSTWTDALEVMRDIRERITPAAVSRELEQMIAQFD